MTNDTPRPEALPRIQPQPRRGGGTRADSPPSRRDRTTRLLAVGGGISLTLAALGGAAGFLRFFTRFERAVELGAAATPADLRPTYALADPRILLPVALFGAVGAACLIAALCRHLLEEDRRFSQSDRRTRASSG